MEAQIKKLKDLITTDFNPTSSSFDSHHDDDEIAEKTDNVYIYTENPYQSIATDEDTKVYQVLGNEIIIITKGHGVCCVCHTITDILYTDNTYGTNIPVQLCKSCIDKIFNK